MSKPTVASLERRLAAYDRLIIECKANNNHRTLAEVRLQRAEAQHATARSRDRPPRCQPVTPSIVQKEHRMTTYKIRRFYADDTPSETIVRGLTLEQAQAHCNRDDTHGEGWFDGYDAEG